MLDASDEMVHRFVPTKHAASAGTECIDNRFVGRQIQQNDNWDFRVSRRYRVRQVETGSDRCIDIRTDDYEIRIAGLEHLQEVGGPNRNSFASEITNQCIR